MKSRRKKTRIFDDFENRQLLKSVYNGKRTYCSKRATTTTRRQHSRLLNNNNAWRAPVSIICMFHAVVRNMCVNIIHTNTHTKTKGNEHKNVMVLYKYICIIHIIYIYTRTVHVYCQPFIFIFLLEKMVTNNRKIIGNLKLFRWHRNTHTDTNDSKG